MKNSLKKLTIFTIVAFSTSCVNDSFDTPKNDVCVPPTQTIGNITTPLVKNKEVLDIYAIAINPVIISPSISPNTPTYTANDVIEGYVISNDEGGNFYKSMYVQPLDGSRGFNISYDESNTFTKKYYPGKKVFVKLQGLAYGNPNGSYARGLIFGAPPTEKYDVDRLSPLDFENHIIPSCDAVSEDLIVKKFTNISAVLNDVYLNTLVEISGVQFKDYSPCNPITYSTKDFDTSLNITNGVATTALAIRTSKYSHFAGISIPGGNGTIRGVLSKYGSGYQIILRTERDVKFTNPRVMPVIPVSPPAKIGATSTTFNATLNENFSSYTAPTYDATISKYINQVDLGIKFWDIKSFGTPVNKYIQTSAFNNGFIKNYFVVPVDFTVANGISFKTLDGYNNGVPLKVYYSTNYVPGNKMNTATLIDITSNFVLADGRLATPSTTGAYAATFTPSGTYSFPASLTGNGYIIFEYDGTCYTTTYQIDDIVIN